ncbi:MAG: helix-turn-helix domain-containing protein [Actinomycetota bacterium]|nr:helix-turn-helix domain-containing protein [Actinomycetota bacterium]
MTTTGDNRHYDDIDDLLTLHEVAELLRVPEATLRYWRHQHTGPDSYKVGRHVRYPRSEVQRWLRSQRSSRSSDVA